MACLFFTLIYFTGYLIALAGGGCATLRDKCNLDLFLSSLFTYLRRNKYGRCESGWLGLFRSCKLLFLSVGQYQSDLDHDVSLYVCSLADLT